MKKNKTLLVGLPILLAGIVGIYLLFAHPPAEPEEQESEIETVVPVHAGKIVRTTLHEYEVAYGHVEAALSPPARMAVRAAVDGVLAQVSCQPGQTVEAGDELFWIDERVAKLEVDVQQQNLDFAQQEFNRQEQLLQVEGTSEREYQQAARDFNKAEQTLDIARVALDYYSVRAPISGTVVSVNVAIGEPVQSIQALAEIVDPTRQIISVQVPAAVANRIQLDQPIQIFIDPTWQPAGQVNYIAKVIDPQTGTVEVRADLPAPATLLAGQFIKTRIELATHVDCLAVPASALVEGPDHETFIAIISGDRAQHNPVTRKLREDDLVEVEGEGLAEGMEMVTEGAYGLPEQTRIEVIEGL